jgi:hypothetical protein
VLCDVVVVDALRASHVGVALLLLLLFVVVCCCCCLLLLFVVVVVVVVVVVAAAAAATTVTSHPSTLLVEKVFSKGVMTSTPFLEEEVIMTEDDYCLFFALEVVANLIGNLASGSAGTQEDENQVPAQKFVSFFSWDLFFIVCCCS